MLRNPVPNNVCKIHQWDSVIQHTTLVGSLHFIVQTHIRTPWKLQQHNERVVKSLKTIGNNKAKNMSHVKSRTKN